MTTLNLTKKQYSQPEIIEIGDVVKTTLGKKWGRKRDYRKGYYRKRRRHDDGYGGGGHGGYGGGGY
ncbi:hypothetical protein BZZ01_01345 [Nostocales cyanobacterium HT-58-2]|nr:hypothetical protein BZZ01_01345 [Nostocales cyanobacterium HT-58-2]